MRRRDHLAMLREQVNERRAWIDRVDAVDQQDRLTFTTAQHFKVQPTGAQHIHAPAAAAIDAVSSIGGRSRSCGSTSRAASMKLFSASACVTRPCRVIMMMRPT